MKINNGFIKLVNGDWVNISSVHALRILQCDHPKKGMFFISAVFDKYEVLGMAIDKKTYESKEEAQVFLDYCMRNLGD